MLVLVPARRTYHEAAPARSRRSGSAALERVTSDLENGELPIRVVAVQRAGFEERFARELLLRRHRREENLRRLGSATIDVEENPRRLQSATFEVQASLGRFRSATIEVRAGTIEAGARMIEARAATIEVEENLRRLGFATIEVQENLRRLRSA